MSNVDLSASFQACVLDILMAKTKKALEKYPVKTLVVAGGVAANQGLRERLAAEITDVEVIIPPLRLCGDNAGMIALAAVSEYNKENIAGWDLNAKPKTLFHKNKWMKKVLMKSDVITITNLNKYYGSHKAVSNLNLSVHQGGNFGF